MNLARGVAYVGGRTGKAGRRWRARTEDGRRPAAGIGGTGGGRQAKIPMSRHGRGLRGRTHGRAGTSHPATERCDSL